MMESRLKALQCHFTWDLDPSRSKLFRLRDELEDLGSEEEWTWRGHIHNLQGFIHVQLGFVEEARRFFSRATETFCQLRNAREGPWLVVNYGNLAWLHHHLQEEAQSQEYLSKAEALMSTYPSPSLDDPNPEVCAEKAWTLMHFNEEAKWLAVHHFETAIDMQPDVQEWKTSQVIALVNATIFLRENLDDGILEEMKTANERDPENLYLAALYLEARALTGENIEGEAKHLARRVFRRPVGSYKSVFEPLLSLYKKHLSVDEAITLAEKALERHPDDRYMQRCVAVCYKRKLYCHSMRQLEPSMIDRAISFCRKAIALYPDSNLKIQIALGNIYSKLKRQAEADQIFSDLLDSDLDQEGEQIVNSYYGKHLFYHHKKPEESVRYYMKAAEIPYESFYRQECINTLKKIRDKNNVSGSTGESSGHDVQLSLEQHKDDSQN